MNAKKAKLGVALGILIFGLVLSGDANAQIASATISGVITGASGAAVPNAKVSVKNAATQNSVDTQTDSSGHYNVTNLTPGDYEVSVSAAGYSTNSVRV